MAHGTPDELNVKSDLTAVLGYTIPETIARLHSAIQYGLPGEVQSVQTWADGIAPWFVELSPGDPYGYLSSDYAVSDGVSMRL